MLEVIQFGIDDTFELMLLLIHLQLMLVMTALGRRLAVRLKHATGSLPNTITYPDLGAE